MGLAARPEHHPAALVREPAALLLTRGEAHERLEELLQLDDGADRIARLTTINDRDAGGYHAAVARREEVGLVGQVLKESSGARP